MRERRGSKSLTAGEGEERCTATEAYSSRFRSRARFYEFFFLLSSACSWATPAVLPLTYALASALCCVLRILISPEILMIFTVSTMFSSFPGVPQTCHGVWDSEALMRKKLFLSHISLAVCQLSVSSTVEEYQAAPTMCLFLRFPSIITFDSMGCSEIHVAGWFLFLFLFPFCFSLFLSLSWFGDFTISDHVP